MIDHWTKEMYVQGIQGGLHSVKQYNKEKNNQSNDKIPEMTDVYSVFQVNWDSLRPDNELYVSFDTFCWKDCTLYTYIAPSLALHSSLNRLSLPVPNVQVEAWWVGNVIGCVLQYFASHPYQYFAGPTPPIIQMPMESEHASTAASPDEAYQPYPPPK